MFDVEAAWGAGVALGIEGTGVGAEDEEDDDAFARGTPHSVHLAVERLVPGGLRLPQTSQTQLWLAASSVEGGTIEER